jgi:hypothetical protein
VSKIKTNKKDKNERRGELLRLSRYLGYDHDSLGLHLFSLGKITTYSEAAWSGICDMKSKSHRTKRAPRKKGEETNGKL